MTGLLLSLAKPNKCLRRCKLLGSYIHPGEHNQQKKKQENEPYIKEEHC